MLLLIAGIILVPQVAEAGCSWWQWLIPGFQGTCVGAEFLPSLFQELGELILRIMSWVVGIAGLVLNIAIVFTLNIKTLYEATPAIEETWIVIRNISSIFIIFSLLYASIITILGVKGPNFGSLVVKIFIAGVLINFSLFFTRVLIDASNLVSMQFYRAIVPVSQNIDLSGGDPKVMIKNVLQASFYEGGLSDVFQQSLKIPKVYNNKSGILGSAHATFLIIVSTIGGSIIMLTAALSFFVAGLAFIIRLVILLLIMGFSPLFFVGMIFPQVDKNFTSEFKKYFLPQLTFMPAYLLFMYVALKFLSAGGFFQYLDEAQKSVTGVSNGEFLLAEVGLIFQFIIALVFINLPLIAAMKLGAMTPKWAGNIQHMAGGLAKRVGSAAGRNTFGRVGKFAGEQFDSMAASAQGTTGGRVATSVLRNLGISQAVRGGISGVEKGKYGHQSLEEVEKEDKERARVVSGVQRGNVQRTHINAVVGTTVPPTPAQLDEFRKTVSGMDNKELEKVKIETLTDPVFASALPSSKFDALMKSDTLTPKQQQDLKTARETGFTNILNTNGANYLVRTVLKGKPGEIAKLPGAVLTNPNIALELDPASLRKMIDENVGQADRDTIRTNIMTHAAAAPGGIPPAGSALAKLHNYLTAGPGQTLF